MRSGIIPSAGYYLQAAAPPPPAVASVSANSSLTGVRTTNLPTDAFSFGYWIKKPAPFTSGYRTFFTIFSSGGSFQSYTYDDSGVDAQFLFLYFDEGTVDVDLSSNNIRSTWFFIGGSRPAASSSLTIYTSLDGTLSSLTTVGTYTLTGAINKLTLFSYDGVDVGQNNYMRAFRMWNVSKSSASLLSEARKSTPIDTANLIANFKLDDATTAGTDSSATATNMSTSGTGATITGDQPSFPDG